ncbi:hypothetical protein Dimus_020833, partial [Dionaea muscipula]
TSTSAVRRLHHHPEKTGEGCRLLTAPPVVAKSGHQQKPSCSIIIAGPLLNEFLCTD